MRRKRISKMRKEAKKEGFILRATPEEIRRRIKEELRENKKVNLSKLRKELGVNTSIIQRYIGLIETGTGKKIAVEIDLRSGGKRKYNTERVSQRFNNIEELIKEGLSLHGAVKKTTLSKQERGWLLGAFSSSTSDTFRLVLSEEERKRVLEIRKKAGLPEYP